MSSAKAQEVPVIVIGPDADTELGRLLDGSAITPFRVVNYPKDHDDTPWYSFNEAASVFCEKFITGEVEKVSQDDENRLAHLLRWKIQYNRYLMDMFSVSKGDFIICDQNGVPIERFDWLNRELDVLRRYFRKSFAQGHQQPFVRPGARRPYSWVRPRV